MIYTTKSGKGIFPIGIGTWEISSTINPNNASSQYKGVEPVKGGEDAEVEAIRYSISMGQNHIDCAELYGGFYTDEVVGQAINGLNREDLFIADKIWKTSVDDVKATVNKMLDKLGTEYLDLLYIHAPWGDTDWQKAIPQIDELIDRGVVRYFGVSNFSLELLKENALESRHGIKFVQQNFSVGYQDEANAEYREWCKQNGIQIVAYCPFDRQAKGSAKLTDLIEVTRVAKNHKATNHQIALAWLLSVGALPIPKSTNKSHIDENISASEIVLSELEVKALNQ